MKPLSVTGIGGLQTPLFKIPQRGVAKVEKILGGGKYSPSSIWSLAYGVEVTGKL